MNTTAKKVVTAIGVVVLSLTTPAAVHAAPSGLGISSVAMPGGSTVQRPQLNTAICRGGGRSPDVEWWNAPAGTRGFAVTMYDPDAPPHGFWHWVAYDIAPQVRSLPEGMPGHSPLARQALHSLDIGSFKLFAGPGYTGPCAPPGTPHRYILTVYALDTPSVGLPDDADPAAAVAAIRSHAIASASLTARYALPVPSWAKGH